MRRRRASVVLGCLLVATVFGGCPQRTCPTCPRPRAQPAAAPRCREQPRPPSRKTPEAWESLATWEKHGEIPRWAVKALPTHNQFVTQVTRVCSTVTETRTGRCQRRSRDMAHGFPRMPGERVFVLGKKPIQGLWPALRFTKGGVLPGFLIAKHAADKPDLKHRRRFFASVIRAKIRIIEFSDSSAVQRWIRSRKRKRFLLKGLVYRRDVLGCVLTTPGVECGLAAEGKPIYIGRFRVRMNRPGAPTGWPLMRHQYVTYFEGEKLDLLVKPDGKGQLTILAIVDRYGVWKVPGAMKRR